MCTSGEHRALCADGVVDADGAICADSAGARVCSDEKGGNESDGADRNADADCAGAKVCTAGEDRALCANLAVSVDWVVEANGVVEAKGEVEANGAAGSEAGVGVDGVCDIAASLTVSRWRLTEEVEDAAEAVAQTKDGCFISKREDVNWIPDERGEAIESFCHCCIEAQMQRCVCVGRV